MGLESREVRVVDERRGVVGEGIFGEEVGRKLDEVVDRGGVGERR